MWGILPPQCDIRIEEDVDTEVEATVRWLDEGFCGLQFGSLRARDVWGLNRIFENARRLGDD